jgi:hypothetical protein
MRQEWITLLGTLTPNAGALRASAIAADAYNMVGNPELTAATTGWAASGAGAAIARVDSSVDPGVDSTTAGAADKWVLKVTNGGAAAGGTQVLSSIIGGTYAYSGLGFAPAANTQVNAHELLYITTDAGAGEGAWEALAFTGVAIITTHPITGECLGASAGDVTYWDKLNVNLQSAMACVQFGAPSVAVTANMISPPAAVTPRAIILRVQDSLNFVRLLLLPNTLGTDTILETVTNGVRSTLASADIDWTPGGTDGVRAMVTDNDIYTVEHMKAGASVWIQAFTAASASYNTNAAFGLQLFSAGDNAFADIEIRQV